MSFAITVGVAGVAVAGAGVAMNYMGQQQAAGAQASIANQNAAIARMNADIDRRAALIQANSEIRAAEVDKLNAGLSMQSAKIDNANARLERVQNDFIAAAQMENLASDADFARIDSETFRKNATTLIGYARTVEAAGAERISRLREDGRRAMSIVRNKVAKGGVVMEGSPLVIAGENAANIELAAQDVNFETRQTARNAQIEAGNELSKSRRSLLQMDRFSRNARTVEKGIPLSRASSNLKVLSSGLSMQAANYAADAAEFRGQQGNQLISLANDRYKVAVGDAEVIRAGGAAAARASQIAAYGTLLSGGAEIAGQAAALIPPRTS